MILRGNGKAIKRVSISDARDIPIICESSLCASFHRFSRTTNPLIPDKTLESLTILCTDGLRSISFLKPEERCAATGDDGSAVVSLLGSRMPMLPGSDGERTRDALEIGCNTLRGRPCADAKKRDPFRGLAAAAMCE